jgi:hypothetical protein
MLRRTVESNSRSYLFSPDDVPPLGERTWALVKLRVTDELNGEPPDSTIIIQAKEQGFVPRVARDGIAGLAGIPQNVFPGLRTTNYIVHLTVSAEGYVSRDLQVPVPLDPTFPSTFKPPPLVNLALHREPVVIAGRTVRLNGNTTLPVIGAAVSVTGIWRTPPPANVLVPPAPPNLVALRPPLYSDRPALTQFMRRRDLTPIIGSEKALVNDLLPGANPILLPDRLGLSVGDVLLIDATEPDLAEFIPIKTVPLTSPANQPTLITFEYPVIRAHRRHAVVQRVTPQPAGPTQQLTVDAIVGDTCVFLNGIAGLAGAHEVLVSGLPDEHHKLMTFSVMSDADGYYRMPPLSRLAQVEIHAEKVIGAQTFHATTNFRPDYRERENRMDLVLKV